jgi:hypothetical protein
MRAIALKAEVPDLHFEARARCRRLQWPGCVGETTMPIFQE